MENIKLGDKVRCNITGLIGTAVARTEFINGCIQYEVLPRMRKDQKIPEGISIDQQSLEVIKPKPKPKIRVRNGGPNHPGIKQRGY